MLCEALHRVLVLLHTSPPPGPPRRPVCGLAVGRPAAGGRRGRRRRLALLVVLLDELRGEAAAVEDGRHDHGAARRPAVVLVADAHHQVGIRQNVLYKSYIMNLLIHSLDLMLLIAI